LLIAYLFLSWATAKSYTVVPGDTLSAIAHRFSTSVSALEQLNSLRTTVLQVGQVLDLPISADLPPGFVLHTVAAGETFASLAAASHVSVAALRAVNPGKALRVGTRLRIPPPGGEVVTFHAGDSLLSLALARGLSPTELLRTDGLSLSEVTPGRVLYLPPAKAPPASTALAAKQASRSVPTSLEGLSKQRRQLLQAQFHLLSDAASLLARYQPPKQGYAWPLAIHGPISSPFGYRNLSVDGSTFHTGMDIAVPLGTPILAARDGVVTRAGWGGDYGYVVYVDQGDGTQTRYAHMSRILARVGEAVHQGEKLGLVGETGAATGPHLHFEIRVNGRAVNPQGYLAGK
jgi:murein DD-endopeptidase MepM/ murein hydrolase activator NlpD